MSSADAVSVTGPTEEKRTDDGGNSDNDGASGEHCASPAEALRCDGGVSVHRSVPSYTEVDGSAEPLPAPTLGAARPG